MVIKTFVIHSLQLNKMKVPSKEDLYKNQFHTEYLTISGEWKRFDTFTFYEFDRAVNFVIKRFLNTETNHRIIDNDGRVIVLLDDTFIEEDEITRSINPDTRWGPGRRLARKKLIKYLVLISSVVTLIIFISFLF